MNVGDRVKYSGYVVNRKRDCWNRQGREPMKSGTKRELERTLAMRGTITATAEKYGKAYNIKWDDGTESQTAAYMVEKV